MEIVEIKTGKVIVLVSSPERAERSLKILNKIAPNKYEVKD